MKWIRSLFLSLAVLASSGCRPTYVVVKDDSYYLLLAQAIDDQYHRLGMRTSSKIVWDIIQEANSILPSYFPNNEIDLLDVLAIASCESQFYEKTKGTKGEIGLFQLLDAKTELTLIGKPDGNPWDPRISTHLGISHLAGKYQKYQDRRKAIIAYNGVIRYKDGTWEERYWRYFTKKRQEMEKIARKVDGLKMAQLHQS